MHSLRVVARSGAWAIVIGLLAGCSGVRSLPAAPAASMPGAVAIGGGTALVSPDMCKNAQKLKLCVVPGGVARIELTFTCDAGKKKKKCGTVTWKTRTSHPGLKGKFSPNPGNPVHEVVYASKGLKLGHYSQTITITCTGVPHCTRKAKGAIWVVKK